MDRRASQPLGQRLKELVKHPRTPWERVARLALFFLIAYVPLLVAPSFSEYKWVEWFRDILNAVFPVALLIMTIWYGDILTDFYTKLTGFGISEVRVDRKGQDPTLNDLWMRRIDASDLQRGDLSPHETFSARLSKEGAVSEVNLVLRVDEPGYRESVTLRKEKLRRKFESSPSPTLARPIREDLGIPENLDDHLRAIRSALVVAEHYEPIPKRLLSETIGRIVQSNIIKTYCDMTGVSFPLNFSTSFVHRGTRQVFWDIVSPQLKFEGLRPR